MKPVRGCIMQTFHWYTSNKGKFWNEIAAKAKDLNKAGITAVWLPPAYKGMAGINDVGYGVYDIFDFGEFDQKGSVRTKYGTRTQYENCIKTLQKNKIQVYADVVLNHKMGADYKENVHSVQVNPYNRNHEYGNWADRELWTGYVFPGRNGAYSTMQWQWWHFDATKEHGNIYKLKGKQFETHVDNENVNYDFLMGCDLDFDVDQVRGEVHYWGKWCLDNFAIDGFRIDAIKHIRSFFFKYWLDDMRNHAGNKEVFAVGEYWSSDMNRLRRYINETEGKMHLFDAPLHYNFHRASKQGIQFDMGSILNNTLVKENPWLAVTLVENHDTQPLQSLESLVEAWFKPIAYAIILLRDEGYPCVFSADYYGAHYTGTKNNTEYEIWMDSHQWMIDLLLEARNKYTFGTRRDYFDHWHTIGWTFQGDANHKSMAVVMTNWGNDTKWMETGKPHRSYTDITMHINEAVTTNEHGWGNFRTLGGKVSVWVES